MLHVWHLLVKFCVLYQISHRSLTPVSAQRTIQVLHCILQGESGSRFHAQVNDVELGDGLVAEGQGVLVER